MGVCEESGSNLSFVDDKIWSEKNIIVYYLMSLKFWTQVAQGHHPFAAIGNS